MWSEAATQLSAMTSVDGSKSDLAVREFKGYKLSGGTGRGVVCGYREHVLSICCCFLGGYSNFVEGRTD